ncbi:hypothetical protein [Agaribacter flavus]|uniref:Uncharacterized protein n=1 Tax=Agaribacter flavus TaxID=1902781 RepID=A0ABV7FLD6_9ALTE
MKILPLIVAFILGTFHFVAFAKSKQEIIRAASEGAPKHIT